MSSEILRLCPLEAKYIPQLVALEKACFKEPWSEQSFCEELENPLAVYVLALLGDTVAAYGGMWVVLDFANINNVAANPAYRKSGYATAVLHELIRLAKERGAGRMTLEVRRSNDAAIALYQKLGFAPGGIRKLYYGDEDAIIMWKEGI